MSVDHIALLQWMAARERRETDYIDGARLMVDASHLAGTDLDPWQALARALELLKQENCIVWRLESGSGGAARSAPFDADTVREMRAIRVSATGHTICLASQVQPPAQINIFNHSSVGQVGMGDNRAGDVHLLFARAQEELDRLKLPEDVKEEARGMLRQLQDAAASIGTPAAASVLALALEQAMHLQ
jgi:hypothetical protein